MHISILYFLILLTSCGTKDEDKSKTMIRVTGAEGIAFEGAVGTAASSSSVTGVTPQEFSFSDKDPIAAVIQKSTKDDLRELIVECWFNSTAPESTAKTSVEFGAASVSCRPLQSSLQSGVGVGTSSQTSNFREHLWLDLITHAKLPTAFSSDKIQRHLGGLACHLTWYLTEAQSSTSARLR